MIMKRTTILFFIIGLSLLTVAASTNQSYNKKHEEKIDSLIIRLTLAEKIELISGDSTGFNTKEIKRLGIPAIRFTDGSVGVRNGQATSFPASIALAATWDTLLAYQLGLALAEETKAKGCNMLLGPTVGLYRHPLGGRNFEAFGEDPFLTTRMAVNWINGLQSKGIAACVKHFAANDQEWERNNYSSEIDKQALHELHLAAFETSVKEAGAMSVMTSYNKLNGHYCSENRYLISDVLKNSWGFKGPVISDWISTYSTTGIFNAGLDLEMPSAVYYRTDSVMKYLNNGSLTEELLNDKVRRILRLATNPHLYDTQNETSDSVFHSGHHNNLSLRIAQEAITLLKNEKVLPLKLSEYKSIAIIGPNAAYAVTGGGGSSIVTPFNSVSPLMGMQNRVGESIRVEYAEGCTLPLDPRQIIATDPKNLFTPDKQRNGLLANYYDNIELKGIPVLTRIDQTIFFDFGPGSIDKKLPVNYFSARWEGWYKASENGVHKFETISDDGIRLFVDDQLLIDNWTNHVPTRDSAMLTLEKGRYYKLKVEYYEGKGDGMIKMAIEKVKIPVENPIAKAVELALKCDVAIIFVGTNNFIETETHDVEDMELPGDQEELIQAVAKANPNTIVVLNGGITFNVQNWLPNIKALLNTYFLGEETGTAIASVLCGDVSPSGKLPYSYIAHSLQSPAFKGYKDPGLKVNYHEGIFLGYRYLEKNKMKPAFPFGFGLSYTTFEYSDLHIEKNGNEYAVKATITNTGKREGKEVVQLYLSAINSTIERPEKELKGFSKVSLKPGESKSIRIVLSPKSVASWDVDTNNWQTRLGKYEIMLGASSVDIRSSMKYDF
jgi:beta-glucosidase